MTLVRAWALFIFKAGWRISAIILTAWAVAFTLLGCDIALESALNSSKKHSVMLKPVPMMRCTDQCVKGVMQNMHNSQRFGGSSSMRGVTDRIKAIEEYCKRVYESESCCHKSAYHYSNNKPFKYETGYAYKRFGMCP